MSLIHSSFKTPFLKGTIILKEKIAEHTYRFTVQGDDIKNLDYIPGQHMKVIVGLNKDAMLNDKVRSYSIWDYDKQNGTMDVAVNTHSNGLGAKWTEIADKGDDFYFFLKTTLTVDDSADSYIFIGDVSTLAHFYKIEKSLTRGKKILGTIYGDNDADFFPDLDGSKPFNFYTLHAEDKLTDNNSAVPISFLTGFFTDNMQLKTDNCIVYLAGDARVCAAITILFSQKLGFAPERIKMKSFWNPDKAREES